MRELGISLGNSCEDDVADVNPSTLPATSLQPAATDVQPPGPNEESGRSSCSGSPKVPRLRLPLREDATPADGSSQLDQQGMSNSEPHSQADTCSDRLQGKKDASRSRHGLSSVHSSGLDPDVDDLLLQLDALDARSKALQRDKMQKQSAAPKQDVSSRRAEDASQATPPEEAEARSKTNAAQSIARQHPLESMRLGFSAGGDLRWHGARSLPKKASTSCVPLPSLKSSASAPACLKHGTWPAIGNTA